MKVLLLLLFVAAASANSTTVEQASLPDQIITNGYTATAGRAPYIVFLAFRNSYCGGSIIGHNWVITASHCTKNYKEVTIHYGSLLRGQGQIVHTVKDSDIINHRSDDIALIHTPYVSFNANINRIQLPPMSDRSNQYVNRWGLACGWGQTATGSSSRRLQCVDLQVISVAQCRQTYSSKYAKEQVLCVATPNSKSICYGDSGGPLVHNNRLIGVSNFVSARGCMSGDPAGFARVTSHLDWIRDYTDIEY